MELVFDNPFGNEYDWLEDRYKKIMEAAFSHLGINVNYEVDVSLVDEETIHQVNREYRNVDRVTDVISFAFNDDPNNLIISNDAPSVLGEILICLEQAKRQALEIGNSLERELSFLFVHGLLHLLGYDHMTKEDEAVMFPLQETILDLLGDKK